MRRRQQGSRLVGTLRRLGLACVLAALGLGVGACAPVVSVGGTTATPPSPPPSSDGSAPRTAREAEDIVALTNAMRRREGLKPLVANPRLMRAAQLHAEQMAERSKMSHDLPGARYPTPRDRLDAVAYHWRAYAENVSWNQRSASEAVEGWMRSPGHRANILSDEYTEIGGGFARNAKGEPYYVQVFGRPASR